MLNSGEVINLDADISVRIDCSQLTVDDKIPNNIAINQEMYYCHGDSYVSRYILKKKMNSDSNQEGIHQLLREIYSPHITRYYGCQRHNGEDYRIYEALDKDLIECRPGMASDAEQFRKYAAVIFVSIMKAVYFLYKNGINYSDLKAENVVVSHINGTPDDIIVKLCDYDAAYTSSAHTNKTGSVLRSAPEVFCLASVPANTVNIIAYQLGTFLFWLYTGDNFWDDDEEIKSEWQEKRAARGTTRDDLAKYYYNDASGTYPETADYFGEYNLDKLKKSGTINSEAAADTLFDVVRLLLKDYSGRRIGVDEVLKNAAKMYFDFLGQEGIRLHVPVPSEWNEHPYTEDDLVAELKYSIDGHAVETQYVFLSPGSVVNVPICCLYVEFSNYQVDKRGPIYSKLILTRCDDRVFAHIKGQTEKTALFSDFFIEPGSGPDSDMTQDHLLELECGKPLTLTLLCANHEDVKLTLIF